MNNRYIENLTHRLLQALDNNYDVINMDAVLSVIAALESTTITKEQLEATRLAKYINLFRRRTKSEQLAKRAKSLLKKWREMVGIQQPVTVSNVTGPADLQYTKPTSPLASSSGAGGSGVSSAEKQTRWNMREESNEPTSFINLIPNISSTYLNHNSSTISPVVNGPNVRAGRKNRNPKGHTEAINSDQFANSNSMNVNTITPTIVIDIEDSNSGSNVIEKQDDVVIIGETTKTSPEIKPSKHKKAKKEKKKPRNAREMPTTLVVIDAESSESQQPVDRITSTMVSAIEKPLDKSKNTSLMATNISEILSLSNSSMSCVFPTSIAGATKLYSSQHAKAPSLTDAELSFAGKFGGAGASTTAKINTCDTSATAGPSSLSGDIYAYNESSNILSSVPTPKTTGKSRIFGGSGYNSNDSVSNSRHSNFENVESVAPGISHASANVVNVAADTVVPVPLEKMPKKRGRKKGSKGVDSLIAKDTSLSSQMLMQSLSGGNKKVKTTKELYAEMQNRKLGMSTPTTPSHWTSGNSQPQQQSRRDSFCSEPSLHSPRTFDACSTNATISTIATSSTTPDKNASGGRKFDTGVVDVDSTSDSLNSAVTSRGSVVQENTPKVLAAVEQQLLDLANKLPSVPSVSEIEKACASEIVPCTCKIIEIMPEQPENVAEQASAAMGDLLSLDKLKNSNLSTGEDNEMPIITISVAGNKSGNEGTVVEPKEQEPAKPKKSIFDLDFDDDEDPLNTLIAEVAAASAVTSSAEISKSINDSPYESKQESEQNAELPFDQANVQILPTLDSSAVPAIPPIPLFPTYKVEEDEYCPAKDRFELQTQQITGFHINLLHNFFIPNVNGNWNDMADNDLPNTDAKQSSFQVVDGLNVVPKLSDEDNIRKDLREFSFRRKLKPKSIETTSKYETPFLGVARCLTKRHRKTRKHRQEQLEDNCAKTSPKDLNIMQIMEGDSNVENTVKMEEVSDKIMDAKVKQEEIPNAWNLSVSSQKPTLEAITVNVDNDNDNAKNAVCSSDSQNLLAIVSNVVGFAGDETSEVNATTDNFEAPLLTDTASDGLVFPKMSGDFLNNNNKSCSSKFEEEPSSCESNSSLKQTQDSINQKLRKHRLRQKRQLELEQSSPKPTKRKRRRKKVTPPIKIKCIKIAINGGITTQRHIKIASSNSGSSSEINSNDDESIEEIKDDDDEQDSEVSNNHSEAEETECVGEINEDFPNASETINDDNEFDIVGGDEDYEHDDENGEYEDDGDDYIGDFHEVVTRDLSPSTAMGNNHIVLTIKKTPSKTNSPASNSPNVINQTTIANTTTSSTINQTVEANDIKLQENTALVSEPGEVQTQSGADLSRQMPPSNVLAAAYASLIKNQNVCRRFRRRRRKRKCEDPQQFRFPDEVCSGGSRIFKKKHQQLFFPEEIYTQVEDGDAKRRIFNISSCSSSCYESSEFEYESNSSDDDTKSQKVKISGNDGQCNPIESSSSSSSDSATDSEDDTQSPKVLETTDATKLEDLSNEVTEDQLSECNNGLLISFNDICMPESDETKATVVNTNSAPSAKASLSNLNPRPEFCTGIRTVCEPMAPASNSVSNNRTQQFKEWHQVLQLKSYNDEPLTVLPYVVLD